MDADGFIKTASVIFAFSGWFKVAYDHQTSKPKVVGKLLNVMSAQATSPTKKNYTFFMLYPYLLNARKNSIHILDYEAFIKVPNKKGWQALNRFYGLDKVSNTTFMSPAGGLIKINGLPSAYIYRKGEPVQQGIPLHGWIPFLGDADLDTVKATEYKLVCIDANSNRHEIVMKTKDIVSLPLLLQIADIELPPDMMEGFGY